MSSSAQLTTAEKEPEARRDVTVRGSTSTTPVSESVGEYLPRGFGCAPGESPEGGDVRLLSSSFISHGANSTIRVAALKRAQQNHGNRFVQHALSQRIMQRKVADQATTATPDSNSHQVIPSGSGEPLDHGTRGFMESRFGADFSDVRVHTDSAAAHSAVALQANAYTTGRDIYFAQGKYSPHTRENQHLLAHELTHTIQQRGIPGQRQTAPSSNERVVVGAADDPLEHQADRAADAVVNGNSVLSDHAAAWVPVPEGQQSSAVIPQGRYSNIRHSGPREGRFGGVLQRISGPTLE
jgi:hypothetical protein